MFNLFRRKLTYTCQCCGETYKGSPSFAYMKPDEVFSVPDNEYDDRVTLDTDRCWIKPGTGQAEDFRAIRATLDIPIHGVDEPFCWGVWVTQSQDNFKRYIETYETDQSGITTFGWLTVRLPHYNRAGLEDYLENLACDVNWDVPGKRPKIVLHESDHPLCLDQRNGISWDKAVNIAQTFLKTAHQA